MPSGARQGRARGLLDLGGGKLDLAEVPRQLGRRHQARRGSRRDRAARRGRAPIAAQRAGEIGRGIEPWAACRSSRRHRRRRTPRRRAVPRSRRPRSAAPPAAPPPTAPPAEVVVDDRREQRAAAIAAEGAHQFEVGARGVVDRHQRVVHPAHVPLEAEARGRRHGSAG